MKRNCNNIGRIFHCSKILILGSKLSANQSKLFTLCSIFLSLCFIFCCILYPDSVNSGPYIDFSAHGNSNYGVLRTSLLTPPNNYGRGNCAHCHEQHASIGGTEPLPDTGEDAGPDLFLLFGKLWDAPIQKKVFCFECHIGTGSYQFDWQRINYSYSYWKGGDNSLNWNCPGSIYESFQFVANTGGSQSNCFSNDGSSHMLKDIRDFLRNKWAFPSNNDYINPCSGCHNPHKAIREFPCSRPSAHTDIYAWDVWGDDEKMNTYTLNYWAPKRAGGGYEPDGSPTQDGSNLADYTTLCTDCHNSTTTINSSRLGRNLYKINWGPNGDFHGGRARIDNGSDFSGDGEYGDLLEPYKVGETYPKINYILSCTDCHEPHGSPNEFLLRKTINGTPVNTINNSGRWYRWCQACHFVDPLPPPSHLPVVDAQFDCFQGGACHRHCNGTACSSNNLF